MTAAERKQEVHMNYIEIWKNIVVKSQEILNWKT